MDIRKHLEIRIQMLFITDIMQVRAAFKRDLEPNETINVQGGNPQPRNGKVIGHIIDHVYEPLEEKAAPIAPDMLSATLISGACTTKDLEWNGRNLILTRKL